MAWGRSYKLLMAESRIHFCYTTRGMDAHPNSAHFASLAVCFLSSAASDAAPAVALAADTTFEFSSK